MKSGPIFGRTVTEVCYIHQYGWYCMQSLTAEETCQILLEKMLGYVSSVSKVDSLFSSSAMPSVESYWQRRERTAAVYCVICTFPWVFCCVFRFLVFLPSNQQALHMDSILRGLTWRMSTCPACGNIHLTWFICKSSARCSSQSWTLNMASISSNQTIYTHSKRNMYVLRLIPHILHSTDTDNTRMMNSRRTWFRCLWQTQDLVLSRQCSSAIIFVVWK